MMGRLTERTREVLALADQQALRLNHEYVGTEHILLGLVEEGTGVAANVLRKFGVDLRSAREEVAKIVRPRQSAAEAEAPPKTMRAKNTLACAVQDACTFARSVVGTEHVLLAVLRDRQCAAARALEGMGLKLEDIRGEVLRRIGAPDDPGH